MSDIIVTVQDEIVNIDVIDQTILVDITNAPGPQGPTGAGVAIGGSTGQILSKASNANYDTQWVNPSGTWGTITGTLSNQTDLQNALNGKFNNPTGDTTQYIAGNGSLITFPTTGQAGTLVREVRNTTGATLTKGTVCYINGANGNKPTVAKAIATSDATSAQTFGLIQADIPNNSNGYLVAFGDLDGLNTSAFTEGAQLYLSATTAGAYTSTKQYAPNHLVYIGVITRSHPTQGRIEVRIQNGYEMDELHNVSAQNPSNNDGLFYNTSTNLWEKKQISTALGFTPVTNSRTITINGVTQDLSANRTFSIQSDSTQLVEHLFVNNGSGTLYDGFGNNVVFNNYNNGTSGVGATLRAINSLPNDQYYFYIVNGSTTTIVNINDRILIINATNPYENGLYYFSDVIQGADFGTPVLTRMTGYDQPSDFAQNILVRVLNRSFTDSANMFVGSITNVTTIGTSEILFTQVDNGRNYGTTSNLPQRPIIGKTYYQTDGVSGQYVYNGSSWLKLSTLSVANYFVQHASLAAYADGATYYFGATSGVATTTQGIQRGIFNRTGTIKSVSLFLRSASTPTTEAITLRLFKATGNGALSQIALTTFSWSGSSALVTVNWTGLNLSVTSGDTYEFSVAIPTMATNPSNVFLSGQIEVEY